MVGVATGWQNLFLEWVCCGQAVLKFAMIAERCCSPTTFSTCLEVLFQKEKLVTGTS